MSEEIIMDDIQIVKLFCNGSDAAVEAVEKKYGTQLLHLARNILSDERDAEECLNDTYLNAWKCVPLAKPDNLKAYLMRSIRNLAFERLRSNRAQKRGGDVTLTSYEELSECIPDNRTAEPADNEGLKEQLESFLDGLSTEKRTIFLKRFWYSYSVSEIAVQMGREEKYISNHLYILKKKLRKHLKRKG
ncbi:MAG: sigma-70 family RNA polymerase sigma factor [Lachnospiraceae bacterium]|nr:sigma-70 family RNA polymerase sigma factor [Lachnospiraceae bacterium]MBO4668942.1 sigma-70 family RNA polymerase sigma factor [Lachnospiraceae bacterium]